VLKYIYLADLTWDFFYDIHRNLDVVNFLEIWCDLEVQQIHCTFKNIRCLKVNGNTQ